MKKNDYIDINYRKESKFNKTDIFEIDILGREVKFIEKEKSEAQLIPIKRRRGPRAAQHPSTFPEDGLSLWLKADAGVSKFSYNYASQIIISGTSTPNFNGTYIASEVPDNIEGSLQSYVFDSPEGNPTRRLRWEAGDEKFILDTNDDIGFISANGTTWSLLNETLSQVVISGFTGIYSGCNGTYNGSSEDAYFEHTSGAFYIDGNVLFEANDGVAIASNNNNNYQGAWTPAQYLSTVELTGAGDSEANGVYTRADSQLNMAFETFLKSGGSITWAEDGWWFTSQDLYRNYNFAFGEYWSTENGEEPVPSASYSNSSRNVGSPTTTSIGFSPSGSVSGSVTLSTVNTESVTGWADQSGNGRNASQYSSGLPVYNLVGGKSFINFNSFIDMVVPTIWDNVQFVGTIFVVARFASSSAGGRALLLNQEGVDGNFSFARGYNSTNAFTITTDDIDVVSSLSLAGNNTNYILGATFSESNIATVYLNGVSNGTGGVTNNTGTNNTLIGGGDESSNIAEMLVYNRVLTDTERLQVETYLNQKYSIY